MAQGTIRRAGSALKQAFAEWRADDGDLLAASVAYYTALSFFPLMLVLISGLGLFLQFTHSGRDAERQILAFLSEQVSPNLKNQVQVALAQVREKAGVGGPVGLATLLLAAVAIFAHVERALDRIWNVETPENRGLVAAVKNTLVVRIKAFLMLAGTGFLVVATFVAGLVLGGVQKFSQGLLPAAPWIWSGVQFGASVGLNAMAFTLLYKFLPKVHTRWGEAAAGGVLAAVIWEMGRQFLAAFLIGNKYASAYGVVGSFIGVMLWIYYASAVLFLGAEFVQVLGKRRRELGS
jgi:membrane protein